MNIANTKGSTICPTQYNKSKMETKVSPPIKYGLYLLDSRNYLNMKAVLI